MKKGKCHKDQGVRMHSNGSYIHSSMAATAACQPRRHDSYSRMIATAS